MNYLDLLDKDTLRNALKEYSVCEPVPFVTAYDVDLMEFFNDCGIQYDTLNFYLDDIVKTRSKDLPELVGIVSLTINGVQTIAELVDPSNITDYEGYYCIDWNTLARPQDKFKYLFKCQDEDCGLIIGLNEECDFTEHYQDKTCPHCLVGDFKLVDTL